MVLFGSKNRLLGLDLGTSEIKVVEVQEAGSGLAVTGFIKAKISHPDERARALKEVIRVGKFRSRDCVSAISGRSVIVRYISLRQMSMDELRGAIRFEADKYIPFEVDDVQMDCAILEKEIAGGGGSPEMKVLLVAVKKSVIEEHGQMLRDAGLTPTAIDVDAFALGNAFEFRGRATGAAPTADRVIALIDIGATKTNITILRGSVNCFSREVYSAGNDFTEAVARKLGLEPAQAEAIKCSPNGREAEVEDATQATLEDLCNEIQLSFDYFEHQFDRTVDEVFVSGGSSRLPGLVKTLSSTFERECKLWNPLEGSDVRVDSAGQEELQRSASQLAVTIGLAARVRAKSW